MDISRRQFLGGALAVSAASVLSLPALSAAAYPTLYGDGVHDDTEALNVFFSGRPVWHKGELVSLSVSRDGPPTHLPRGAYNVSAPIVVTRGNAILHGVYMEASPDFVGDRLIEVRAPDVKITGSYLYRDASRKGAAAVGYFLS